MENTEAKLIKILKDLKEKYFVKSIKLEFEAEGTTLEEARFLKTLSDKAKLELTVKIGGCEAIRDLNDVKSINADNIIVPMIESSYALKKFVKSVDKIFDKYELNGKKLFINTESVCGYKNLDEIIKTEEFKKIDGIILGRSDMVASLGLSKNNVNSREVFDIAKTISQKMQSTDKKFVVGGGIFDDAILFFQKLPYITEFETRKIIFDSNILNYGYSKDGILKAIEFEIEWLKAKKQIFNNFTKEDSKRLDMLNEYYSGNVTRLNI